MVPGRDICLMGETYVTDLTSGGGVDREGEYDVGHRVEGMCHIP